MHRTPEDYAANYLSDRYLEAFKQDLPRYDAILERKRELAGALKRPYLKHYWQNLAKLPVFRTSDCDFEHGVVRIGSAHELTDADHSILYNTLKDLMPWRKGPYEYFGIHIDSEWRSDLKWDRILPHMGGLSGKKIADIGCNNAYYMYRMVPHKPELVIGFEPAERYYFNFLLNQRFCPVPSLKYELMGVEDAGLFESFFDVVLFMGVLYHRRNPVEALDQVSRCLKKGGVAIVESAGIDGDLPVCLIPEKRYMKAPGYWFLPTPVALENMLRRTGFDNPETFCVIKLDANEQRQTPWVGTESLEDFLDPADRSKTVEGYPAPYRIYIKAIKK